MAEYKIVASDLDGTLLGSDGKVSAENFAAISSLKNRGVHFVPASGRSLAEIPAEIKENPDIRYFIHSSGAVVFDKLTGERISFCFPKELSAKIFELLFSTDCHITVRHRGRMYTSVETMNEESFAYYKVWAAHAELLRTVGEPISNFKEKFSSADDVEMISIFIGDNERLFELKSKLLLIPNINVASACPYNIELTCSKAGKGNALLALAEKLGCSVSETIAVGDSENDMPMILAAGLGLAVENAAEELKAKADRVICSNDYGVAKYLLETYFQ